MSLMSTRMGYFVHTKTATKMLKLAPSVMLFPWEIQRKMGVVKMLNPMLIEYTFLSHQWETPGHPFPDMQQLTEHLHAVTTEYFWLDWFCVPQWSRTDEWLDPIAIMIFEVTMRSFQKLCVHSTTSLAVVKRCAGLKMRGFDTEKGWQIDDELAEHAQDADRQLETQFGKKAHDGQILRQLAEAVEAAGVDLEYGVRAWCALERCYLPAAPHRDVRLLKLLPNVASLEAAVQRGANQITAAKAKGAKTNKGEEDSLLDAASPVALLINDIERLKGVIDLCQPSEANRALYMNAWSYHYLKRCVLTITNPKDYDFLDVLFVNSVDLGAYGSLYIASVADDGKQVTRVLEQMDERPTSLVEPRVHFPKGAVPPTLTLSALIGSEQVGIVAETFGGIRLAQVIAVELERKRVFIKISDAGLLGAPPTVTEFEVRWKGSRSNITALITKQTTNRSWTLADRKMHIEQQRVLRLRQAMKGWLQA